MARWGDQPAVATLEVEPKDGLNEAQVIPGPQFFKVDDTDLPVAAFDGMGRRRDDTLRQFGGLVTDCRDAWVVLFNLGDAVPLCPQHAVARDVRQQTSVQLFCDRSQLSLDQVSPCRVNAGQVLVAPGRRAARRGHATIEMLLLDNGMAPHELGSAVRALKYLFSNVCVSCHSKPFLRQILAPNRGRRPISSASLEAPRRHAG
jgi:hypothetical protein